MAYGGAPNTDNTDAVRLLIWDISTSTASEILSDVEVDWPAATLYVVTKTCETCGQGFTKPKNRSVKAWQTARFCSYACMGRGYHEAAEARKPPKPFVFKGTQARTMPSRQPEDWEVSWAAGFWEGEGSAQTIGRTFRLSAAQKYREPLDKLREIFGGTVVLRQANGHKRGPLFHWHVAGDKATRAALDILPFVHSPYKKAQLLAGLPIMQPKAG